MEFKKQLVTPTIAKQLLEANTKNRRIKNPVVARYAQDIKAGRWKPDTGECIKISETGVVLDGQHRLMAIIKANTPVYLHIAYNVKDEVFDVLDTGSSRNASDIFNIQKIKNDNVLPAIIQNYYYLKTNALSRTGGGGHKNMRYTNAELLTIYENNSNYWQHIAANAVTLYKQFAMIIPPSVIGSCYAYFYDINKEDAEMFMTQLCTGQDIENNTIAILRTALMKDKMSHRKILPTTRYCYIIKTWNAFRTNKVLTFMRFTPDIEEFPKAI